MSEYDRQAAIPTPPPPRARATGAPIFWGAIAVGLTAVAVFTSASFSDGLRHGLVNVRDMTIEHAAFDGRGGPRFGGWDSLVPNSVIEAFIDARADRMIRHLAVEIDATNAQQDKLKAILHDTVKDVLPVREKMLAARMTARELLRSRRSTAPRRDPRRSDRDLRGGEQANRAGGRRRRGCAHPRAAAQDRRHAAAGWPRLRPRTAALGLGWRLLAQLIARPSPSSRGGPLLRAGRLRHFTTALPIPTLPGAFVMHTITAPHPGRVGDESPETANSRILLIEDDRRLAEMVATYLGGFGFAVTAAHAGNAGVALHARESFDAVVLDHAAGYRRPRSVPKAARRRRHADPHADGEGGRRPIVSSGSRWAPTTICRNHSSRASCWRGCDPFCAVHR